MKLYRSRKNPTRWIACTPTSGWVVFPAEDGGWHKRQPVRGLDPIDLREVPLDLAAKPVSALSRAHRIPGFRRPLENTNHSESEYACRR